MYIAQSRANRKEEPQLIGPYVANTAEKINIQEVAIVTLPVCANLLVCKYPLVLFPCIM
jgi:hypothetical protein